MSAGDLAAAWLRRPTSTPEPLGTKPLLLLDVDGPLNPYPRLGWLQALLDGTDADYPETRPQAQDTGRAENQNLAEVVFTEHEVDSHGRDDMEFTPRVRVRLSPSHGRHLVALSATYDLVWCTFWEYAANHSISPLLGLGDLHAVTFPTKAIYAHRTTGSWKTPHLLAWLDEQLPSPVPWLWVDDEVDQRDQALADSSQPGVPTEVMSVDPYTGLSETDFAAIRDFGEEARRWMTERVSD